MFFKSFSKEIFFMHPFIHLLWTKPLRVHLYVNEQKNILFLMLLKTAHININTT